MSSIILILLGVLEIFAGAIVYFHYFPIFVVFLWFGAIYIVKGIWSVVSSVAVGNFFDWMGAIDFLVGLTMISIFYGNIFWFFWIIGLAHLLKGTYTIILSI